MLLLDPADCRSTNSLRSSRPDFIANIAFCHTHDADIRAKANKQATLASSASSCNLNYVILLRSTSALASTTSIAKLYVILDY